MPLAFKKGDRVRQVVPVIAGEVVSTRLVDDDVQFEVEYVDAAGETQRRFFKEAEIAAAESQSEPSEA